MSNPKHYQVLIVGAGPTGLLLGILLRMQNISCLIIDKLSEPLTATRAVMLHSGSIEIFHHIELLDAINSIAKPSQYITFYYHNTKKVTIDFSNVDSHYNYYLLLKQPELEQILTQRFLSLGGLLERDSELIDIGYQDGYVTCSVKKMNDTIYYHADYVIGCDGASSMVRKLSQISMIGDTLDFHYILAEGKTTTSFPEDESSMYLSDTGLLSVIPLPDGSTRIAGPGGFDDLSVLQDEDALKNYFESTIVKLNMKRDMTFKEYHQIAKYSVHQKLANRFRDNRVFLAGDAAHLHTPAGGQAMNTGFHDVWNLGWKLSFVLNGIADESLLDTYETERRPIAEDVIKTANFFDFVTKIKSAKTTEDITDLEKICHTLSRKICQNYINYQTGSLDDKKYNGQIATKLFIPNKLIRLDYSKYQLFPVSNAHFSLCNVDNPLAKHIKINDKCNDYAHNVMTRPDGVVIEDFLLNTIEV